MHDFIRKLWNSRTTIAIILWIAVFAWAYNLDWVKKPIVQHKPVRKTVEEIMATPVDTVQEAPWDNDFKSAVETM
jgi:hypothetical protein